MINRQQIAFFAAIEANAAGQLAQKITDVLRAGNNEMLEGFLSGIFSMVDAVVASGAAPSQNTQKLDLLLAMAANDTEKIGSLLGELCAWCHACRDKLTTRPTEPKTPQAQKIEIVGMPERVTSQTVDRDVNDEIVGTRTVERDTAR